MEPNEKRATAVSISDQTSEWVDGNRGDNGPELPVNNTSNGPEGASGSPERVATADPAPQSLAEAEATCAELASHKDILSVVDQTLRDTGFAGPTWPVQLVTLAIFSRHLDRPVSVVLRGESASGKSHIIKRALEFAASEAHYAFTAMSSKALFYDDTDLSHKMLVAYEGEGLMNDHLAYAVRSLLSEGRLDYRYTDYESKSVVSISKEGPAGLITSTAGKIDYELGTRVISIPTDDSPDVTAAIMGAEADQASGNVAEAELDEFSALDLWIGGDRKTVLVPFARRLSEATDSRAVRMRRDFSSILGLVQAHALMHQRGREINDAGQVVATLDDYAAVHHLVGDLIAYTAGDSVPPEIRETVEFIRNSRSTELTVSEIADGLGLHRTSVSRRVRRAEAVGYLKRSSSHARVPYYSLDAHVPGDSAVLPHPSELV